MSCDPLKFSTSCFDNSAGYPQPCHNASCHFTGIDNPHNVVYMHRKYHSTIYFALSNLWPSCLVSLVYQETTLQEELSMKYK